MVERVRPFPGVPFPRARPAVALAAALALAACAQTGDAVGDPGPAPEPDTAESRLRAHRTFKLKVTGMTCPIRCVLEVMDQLKAVRGVLHVEVDHDRRLATVDVAPGTDPDALVRALQYPYAGRLL